MACCQVNVLRRVFWCEGMSYICHRFSPHLYCMYILMGSFQLPIFTVAESNLFFFKKLVIYTPNINVLTVLMC